MRGVPTDQGGSGRQVKVLASVTEGSDLSESWHPILSIITENASTWDRQHVRKQLQVLCVCVCVCVCVDAYMWINPCFLLFASSRKPWSLFYLKSPKWFKKLVYCVFVTFSKLRTKDALYILRCLHTPSGPHESVRYSSAISKEMKQQLERQLRDSSCISLKISLQTDL